MHLLPDTNRCLSQNRGFTVLYAMLIITLVFSIASSVFNIMLKELELSQFGRESTVAYYAAESGAECAFYWASKGETFDNGTTLECNGTTVTVSDGSFELTFLPENTCAEVTVDMASMPRRIMSRGYNTPCDATAPGRLERGIQIDF